MRALVFVASRQVRERGTRDCWGDDDTTTTMMMTTTTTMVAKTRGPQAEVVVLYLAFDRRLAYKQSGARFASQERYQRDKR